MKNILILIFFFIGLVSFSQKVKTSTVKKDSIKTEYIEVVTSYTPRLTDADKIKRKPTLELTQNVDKKKLEYTINSVPVASTFVPKQLVMKTIDVGERERLFNSYAALGFGNNLTPYVDFYLHRAIASKDEYGIKLKGIYSNDPVKNTELNSSYYNTGIDAFYKKEAEYFDWTAGLKADRNMYNWYGLPENINYNKQTIDAIDEIQNFGNYQLLGLLEFDANFLDKVSGDIGYFHNNHSSSEISANGKSSFIFPIDGFVDSLNDITLDVSLNFLTGTFKNNYLNEEKKNHQFITTGINPNYILDIKNIDINIGAKGYYTMDTERNEHKFYLYPDVNINLPLSKNISSVYLGVTGDLEKNSFKSFTSLNPYISPTLDIFQTDKKYNFYGGFKGIISKDFNYNLKGGYVIENNKPFFIAQQSKSNGTSSIDVTGRSLFGYEYGNAFNVVYDNTKTMYFLAELEYELSDNINIGLNGRYNSYELNNLEYAFNLPEFKSELFIKYNTARWYAGGNFYYVGSKKGTLYSKTAQEATDLKGYIDLNINGGYHINSVWSVFVKTNNITNSTYQRFTNYNSQGFQVIGGVIFKFDTFF